MNYTEKQSETRDLPGKLLLQFTVGNYPDEVEGLISLLILGECPGFGQDRVNFHQNPGRGTAGWAEPTPTWPNGAGYSIPCAVMLGSGGGGSAAGTHLRLGSARCRLWRVALQVVRFMSCLLLICIVVAPVSLCLLFC